MENKELIGQIRQRLEILYQMFEQLEQGGGGSPTDAYTKAQTDALLNGKVDKVAGSSLMTTAQANKLAGIESGAEVNVQADWDQTDTTADDFIKNKPTIPDTSDFYTKTEVDSELSGKVDKQTGYSLISDTNITKLNGIQSGAEVNVQANWNETDTTSDSYILNKPTIPDLTNYYTKTEVDSELGGKVDKQTGYSLISDANITKLNGIAAGAEVNVQADWNETNVNADSYILNKPTIPDLTNYYNKTETDAEIQGAITDLDVPSTSTTGHYIKSIAQTDGLIVPVAELADTTPAIGSSKLITSGAVYTSLSSKASNSTVSALSSEVNVVAKVAKNKFYRQLDRPSTVTDNNVTITYQSDNSIILAGTASAQTDFYLGLNYDGSYFTPGDILSGVPANSGLTMFIQLSTSPYTRYANDSGSGATIPSSLVAGSKYRIILRVPNGTNTTGMVVKPMICSSEIYSADPSFVKGAPTNAELYDMIRDLQPAQT